MLVFLLILLAVAAALQAWSLSHALDGVSHRYEAEPRVVEPDAPFFLITRLTNTSRRFVPFLRVSEELPAEMEVPEAGARLRAGANGTRRLVTTAYLLARQRWTRRLEARISARGRYVLRGARLSGGDFLGLSELTLPFAQASEVVVLPRPWEQQPALEALGGFLGDVSVNRFILEDPVLTLGYREYTGREPQKAISWAQSARLGRLMVKNYDHTLELSATVLLCADGFSEENRVSAEGALSLARTVCQTLEDRRISYRFLTNARAEGAFSYWSRAAEGMGSGHLAAILEGLGRASYTPSGPFDAILRDAARVAEPGRCHLIVAPALPPALRAGAAALRARTGGGVLLLSPDETVRL